jgi:transketolase C-terminal domain/subunit
MKRVGIADVFSESASNDALLEKYGLTSGHIAAAATALVSGATATTSAKR